MGRQANLCWMLGAPKELECPSCKEYFLTHFDDYGLDYSSNSKPGKWTLHAYCSHCNTHLVTELYVTVDLCEILSGWLELTEEERESFLAYIRERAVPEGDIVAQILEKLGARCRG